MHAAELLRWDDRIGRIQSGYLADMIAVPGNPLNDIRLLERPDFVLKDGVLVRGPMDRQAGLTDSFAGDMTVETS